MNEAARKPEKNELLTSVWAAIDMQVEWMMVDSWNEEASNRRH